MKTISKISLLIFVFALSANSVFAQLDISFTVSDYNGYGVSCFSARDGAVTVTATGGTPPYTYAWSNEATTATIANLAASYYSVDHCLHLLGSWI